MDAAAARVASIGDNVVDRYVERGIMFPGGNAVNVAVHVRRLGATAAYIGAVGTDRAGQVVLAALRDEGVDTSAVRVLEGPNAAATVRVVDGNRVFAGGSPGVSRFQPSERDLELLGGFDIVHTGECSYLEEYLPALRLASARLSFDFSERPWDYVKTYARHVDVAIASLPTGDRSVAERAARALRALGPEVAAVTMGPAGAVLDDGAMHYAAAGTGRIVDTLGAGDSFIARLLTGLAMDEPHEATLEAATTYATRTCSTFGAFGHEASIDIPTSTST